ncbi:hypothetical protein [Winslowiella arboricola]|uniref:hypothetical protein n=1 Tax=Winslowiella arboricola TaxID=2978220 RepID=UPI00225E3BD1|nr:hypothetical protein [Winslowiella arboricola]MCU5775193.1 hypothetical protein [Winslowiella arboricola]
MSDSLATGAKLTPETFADFVSRLKYHRRGEGVNDHCTADAFFVVQRKRLVSGIDPEYTDQLMVYCDDWQWFSIQEYWDDLEADGRAELNKKAQDWCSSQFMKSGESDQWYLIGQLENHTVTGYQWEWEHVNSHFTKEAAEAFIKRKAHDYSGLRVYVDSQCWSWEFNTIINAIIDGRLALSEVQP